MNFTFGIITTDGNEKRVKEIKQSIRDLNIPSYEIIVIGGNDKSNKVNEYHIEFDDNFKKGWITLKKNIITEFSRYDNIVYLHDYIKFDKNWYNEFLKFDSDNDWDVCMNQILNFDNSRYRDWVTWDDPDLITGKLPNGKNVGLWLVDYDTYKKKEYMYVSGAYWVAKKDVMVRYPLNNKLLWGGGEDVEWSKRVLPNVNYIMNKHSIVRLMKYKDVVAKIT